MEQVKKRLGELHNFINSGIDSHYRSWMERKFTEHPNLMYFEIEKVPEWLAKGVVRSTLARIEARDIKSAHHALDSFSFILPFQITTHETSGYWGDPYEAKGKLKFNISYHKENTLSINASYNTGGMKVYKGVTFRLDDAETVIVDYVTSICNGLRNVKKLETKKV